MTSYRSMVVADVTAWEFGRGRNVSTVDAVDVVKRVEHMRSMQASMTTMTSSVMKHTGDDGDKLLHDRLLPSSVLLTWQRYLAGRLKSHHRFMTALLRRMPMTCVTPMQ